MYTEEWAEALALRFEREYLTYEKKFLRQRAIRRRRRGPGAFKCVLSFIAVLLCAYCFMTAGIFLILSVALAEEHGFRFSEAVHSFTSFYPGFFAPFEPIRTFWGILRWESSDARLFSGLLVFIFFMLPCIAAVALQRCIAVLLVKIPYWRAMRAYTAFKKYVNSSYDLLMQLQHETMGDLRPFRPTIPFNDAFLHDLFNFIGRRYYYFWKTPDASCVFSFEKAIYRYVGDEGVDMKRMPFTGCHWERKPPKAWPEWYKKLRLEQVLPKDGSNDQKPDTSALT